MKPFIKEVYLASRPYWATRFNDIHVPLAYEHARQLLLAHPMAEHPAIDEDIVLAAILMHDNGWKMLSEEEQSQAFGPNMTRVDLRRQHEVAGVRIAEKILVELNYEPAKRHEILDIIDGHDSREEAISWNDRLVKDADKLWRFSPTGLDIDHRRFGKDLQAHAQWSSEQIEEWFFTMAAKEMARDLLKLSLLP